MQSETSRIEAFSDGVFAIAATLLILDVKIPQSNQANLAAQLGQQWPSYFAFLLSFLFIGIMWINHHRLFTHIKRTDNGLLILNLLLLLSVCAVPFPTAVLAVHLRSAGAHVAAILYNGTYIVIAAFFNLGGDTRSPKTCSITTRKHLPTPYRNSMHLVRYFTSSV